MRSFSLMLIGGVDMSLQITSKQLMYKYTWTADTGDNPKRTGKPDNILLDRDEGYEVLPFINALMKAWDMKEIKSANKIEYMIKEKLPGSIRKRSDIKQWISENWKETNY